MTSLHRTAEDEQAARQSRASVETRALRMLHAGDSHKDVAQSTGLTTDEIRQLALDFPSTARPAPRATAAAPADGARSCDHILELPVHVLTEHPANVRTDLGDPVELEQLARSIRQQGILQPLVVMRRDRQYVLLAGHRRLAAAVEAGVQRVPVVFRSTRDDADSIEAMLVENLQRANLHPLDEAQAYRTLLAAGRTASDVARSIGKNPGHVSQRLALLNLTPAEQDALRRREISVDDGYKTGRDRSTRRRPHDTKRPKPKVVPHFTKNHSLAGAASARCDHDTLLKLGVACGPCWEATIRADEQRRADGWSA